MSELHLPEFYSPSAVDQVWRVPYEQRAQEAKAWAVEQNLQPAAADKVRTWLMLIDVQNTFCLPEFELFVAGRSGTGAVDDNRRLCEFIYRNLGMITQITATMDTHQAMQIFHAIFLVDENGGHPAPYTTVTAKDIRSGRWMFNPSLGSHYDISADEGQERLRHYTDYLEKHGKYALTIWPYHAMLGGIGHALVASVEEALFFHSVARLSPTHFEIKGDRSFTEHYSVIGPEVEKGPKGEVLGEHNSKFVKMLKEVDRLVIAGQAKSHCVAWSIADLLDDLRKEDPTLARKIYLLDDCSSPVVVPGADFTEAAEQAYAGFVEAGMHLVHSTDLIDSWPDAGE
jgi:nicotinamidase-related amidase